MGSQEVLTWEADELRSGMRKIPGYAGHLTGMRHTLGMTYGRASSDALGDGGENMCKKKWDSAILGHRHDGFTTAAHPDFPFKDEVYRKRPTEYFARVIPRYAGHRPGWTHAPGATLGKYAGETMNDFSNTTRKKSKSLRVKTVPAAVFALPDPKPPPPTVPLYAAGPSYIPHTTLYTPAAVERFGAGFSTLSRDAFAKPVPPVPAPLQNPLDGKALDHLALPSSYMGYKPRALPFLCRHLDERRAQDRERQREIEAYEQQQETAEMAATQQQQESHGAQEDFPAEMYEFLDKAQGDERFTSAVHEAAEKYRQERDANGEEAGMRVWEDHKAYLEMTFLK